MRNYFYKVIVTKDFPKIYEERVHFEGDDTENDVAIVEDKYYVDEPYSEHWVPAVVLNKPDWHWEIEDAFEEFDRRKKESKEKRQRQSTGTPRSRTWKCPPVRCWFSTARSGMRAAATRHPINAVDPSISTSTCHGSGNRRTSTSASRVMSGWRCLSDCNDCWGFKK